MGPGAAGGKLARAEPRRYREAVAKSPDFIVFSDDWGRWPSSSQHLFRHIAQDHRVLWVETVGMRRPRAALADLRRTVEKVRSWTGSAPEAPWAPVPERLVRFAPPMHPWFGSALGDRINDGLLARAVRRRSRELGLQEAVVVITVPIAAGVAGRLNGRTTIYYRVDDFALWPGYKPKMIREREALLLRRSSGLVVTAERLRIPSFEGPQMLLEHGVDMDHFAARCPPPEALTAVRDGRPLLLFAGRIDQRLDPELLRDLPGQVVLVGKQAGATLPSDVTVLPPVPYAELPSWLGAADVLLLPFARGRLSDTIQPLKLREYLATGRPIAVSGLPEVTRICGDVVQSGADPQEFAAACRRALQEPAKSALSRQGLVAEDSWAARAGELLTFATATTDG